MAKKTASRPPKNAKKTASTGLKAQKQRLLMASLPHVGFDGWGEPSLRHAAKDIGMDAEKAFLLIGDKPRDHVTCFLEWANAELRRELSSLEKRNLKIREKIALGVKTKLEILAPHREAERRACLLLSRPAYADLAAKTLYDTCDIIWRAAGDNSADFNFYTKRGLLAGVYSSTLLYWLQDGSEDFIDTYDFLNRRIDNVMMIQKIKSALKDPTALKTGFSFFRKFAA